MNLAQRKYAKRRAAANRAIEVPCLPVPFVLDGKAPEEVSVPPVLPVVPVELSVLTPEDGTAARIASSALRSCPKP